MFYLFLALVIALLMELATIFNTITRAKDCGVPLRFVVFNLRGSFVLAFVTFIAACIISLGL